MKQILSTRIGRVTAASALIGASVLGVANGVAAADPAPQAQNARVAALPLRRRSSPASTTSTR